MLHFCVRHRSLSRGMASMEQKSSSTSDVPIRFDEGQTLETSASESLYGGLFTLSTQLIKPNYNVPYSLHHTRVTQLTTAQKSIKSLKTNDT